MLTLRQIPVWSDNYAYLLVHHDEALLVDAPEAGPVLEVIADMDVTLRAVFNTHHHPDHVGANAALVAATGCAVFGPAHDAERIPEISMRVTAGATCGALGLSFRVLDVHAHTRGHIAYALDDAIDLVIRHGHGGTPTEMPELAGRGVLFVGDSLFAAGCGRLFEGTAGDLKDAMTTLAAEDDSLLVACAHEYTEGNLRFAAEISGQVPASDAIRARLAHLEQERGVSGSSVPSLLGEERRTNPFLLALDPTSCAAYAESLGEPNDPVAVLGAL